MEDKKQVKEINASSMADIAFLLLIFFLVATTMNVDTGITRQLPPIPPEQQITEDLKVRERNLMPILVNNQDAIMVQGQPMHISQLTAAVQRFVLNPTGDENMPEKKNTDIPMPDGSTWTYPVSEGVVSLQSTTGASYDAYVQVQNELTRAFSELREDLSMQRFRRSYTALTAEEQTAIELAIPLKVSEAEPRNVEAI
ncbi:MAG: biopolymer transporter ExbD [Alistipes sp.]|jgi:biopolymer transport protein ExbD|nr:biopolymer transporter ExbD [Alistipes sp.]